MAMKTGGIRVEGLGKLYRIGGPVERYRTFRDTIAQGVARFGRRVKGLFGADGNGATPKYETIWALKDVSFEIQPGEVVGVIGRNGAGKSTLLKILSRITEPTEGRVEIRGRVGSLLEVGTGFHPELTGRENVYLNGAILGMKRAEVDRKFDEIVAFAEIEKFIDTPVKHYSSGMYVRLAFSVAAHLDTDILLVDEVLSVGDSKFQQKCLRRMQDGTLGDRTVLFVSHNLPVVGQFCPRTLLLESGKVAMEGETHRVVTRYLDDGACRGKSDLLDAPRRSSGGERWNCLRRAEILVAGEPSSVVEAGGDFSLRVECDVPPDLSGRTLCFGFDIRDGMDRVLFGTNTHQYLASRVTKGGKEIFHAYLRGHALAPGKYWITLWLGDGRRDYEIVDRALSFEVVWTQDESLARPPFAGVIHQRVEWDFQ